MKEFASLRRMAGLTVLIFGLCLTARATEILNVTTSLTTADPTELGRLSRNGIPQDWVNTEPFPGIINTTTVYHYRTFVINAATIGLGPFIQITIDDRGGSQGNLFASAYFTSFNPNSSGSGNLGFDTNWLGDAGSSGNFFGVDPAFFQVTAHLGSSLVVVVANSGAANLGVGEQFNLLVESFSDTEFTDARTSSATPDAGNGAFLLALGLTGLAVGRRTSAKGSQVAVGRAS